MQEKSFEELLKEQTEGFEPHPKQGLWESIETQLPAEKRKKRMVWLWFPVLLLASGIGAYALLNRRDEKTVAFSELKMNNEQVGYEARPLNEQIKNQNSKVKTENVKTVDGIALTQASPTSNLKAQTSNSKIKTENAKTVDGIALTQASPTSNLKPQTSNSKLKTENVKSANDIALNPASPTSNSTVKTENAKNANDIELNPVAPASNPKPQTTATAAIPKADTLIKKDTVSTVKTAFEKPHKFYIDAVINPVWSGVQLQKSASASGAYNNRKETDKKIFSYGAGLHAGRQFGRISIYSGIEYLSVGYKLYVRDTSYSKSYVANAPADFASADSFRLAGIGAAYPTAVYSENKFHYLCIPLGANVNVLSIKTGLNSKLDFGITANMAYARLLSYQGLLYQENSGLYVKQRLAKEEHISKTNMMASFGFDVSCSAGKKGNIFLRPLYGFSILPAENKPLKTNHRFWSIGLGFRWYL